MRLTALFTAMLLWSLSSLSAGAQTCTVTATGLTFNPVDVLLGSSVDTTGTVSVQCTGTKNTTVRVCLNIGYPNGASPGGNRIAVSGSDQLSFQLYTDAARSTVWGSYLAGGPAGVSLDVSIRGSGSSATVNQTVYGRVFGSQSTVGFGTFSALFTGMNAHFAAQYAVGADCTSMTGGSNQFPFTVTAVVPAKCTVSNATLDFGAQSVLSSNIDASTNLSVSCSRSLPYSVALDGGLTGATDPTQRAMTKVSERVYYGLYRDSTRTQGWGATTNVNTLSGTGTGLAQSVPVYGRVPPQTTPSPGTYTDTVVVTLTY